MSTIKVTNISHPSAASPAIVLDAAGNVTVEGMGLVLVSPISIANSGGSASVSGGAVSFTGVTSVSLNGVFTSAYDNYRIIIRGTASTSNDYRLRYRASGSDASGATDYIYTHTRSASNSDTPTSVDRSTGTSYGLFGYGSTAGSLLAYDIQYPFIASSTVAVGFYNYLGANFNNAVAGIYHGLGVSYDGFTFYTNTGTITGTLRVYGYRNS